MVNVRQPVADRNLKDPICIKHLVEPLPRHLLEAGQALIKAVTKCSN